MSRADGGGGDTHTAYHKGASGRRNVYMMSNDSPKIGLSFREEKKEKKKGRIKDSPDKRSQEEESRVVVALSEFS